MKTRYAMVLGLFVAGAAAAQNYTIQSSSQAYTQMTGGTSLVGFGSNMFAEGDDDVSIVIPIGFTFPYYGQTFTKILINTNGLLSFSTSNNVCPFDTCWDPDGIPSTMHMDTSAPHNLLAPWWSDSAIGSTTDVVYSSSASQFTIEFRNLVGSDQSDNIYSLNFSVTLFPSGVIQFAYGSSGNAQAGGDGAAVGFENGDGTMGASLPLPPSHTACSTNSAGCDTSVNWPANTLYTVGQQVQPDLVVDHITLNSVTHSGANLTVSISADLPQLRSERRDRLPVELVSLDRSHARRDGHSPLHVVDAAQLCGWGDGQRYGHGDDSVSGGGRLLRAGSGRLDQRRQRRRVW